MRWTHHKTMFQLMFAMLALLGHVAGQACDSYPQDSTITVSTCEDLKLAVECSVREIQVDVDLLCQEEIVVSGHATVSISGIGRPSINSAGLFRLFTVSNANLTLSGLDLFGTASRLRASGGIVSAISAQLFIENCKLFNGFADEGGAIFAEDAVVILSESLFTGGIVTKLGGFMYAPLNVQLNMTGCVVSHNYAAYDGGGLAAIGSSVFITNCSFEFNFALNRGGSIVLSTVKMEMLGTSLLHSSTRISTASRGGSLFASTSNLYMEDIRVRNSTSGEGFFMFLSECVASVVLSNFREGVGVSGIMVQADNTVFNLLQSSISHAVASGVAGVSCGADTVCNIIDTVFSENYGRSGSIVDFELVSSGFIQNCSFSNNYADSSGCLGLRRLNNVFIMDTIFHDNTVRKSGGAMYLSGATGIVVAGCTFHHNSAGSGGAALIDSLSEVTFSSCTFHDNKASESAGALNINDNSVVDFFNCSLYNHRAIFGGAIVLDYSSDMLFRSSVAHHNSAVYNGGVFEVEGHSSVTILDSDIYDNWAQGGAVAELAIVSYILVNNSRLFRNFANFSGGVISATDDSIIIMNSCFVANNTATYSGGVFSLFNVNLLVVNSSIYDNFAYVDGGILASTLAQSKFENNVISGNIAYRASCFFIDLESTVETVDNTILHNTGVFGGVAFISSDGTWKSLQDVMTNNFAFLAGSIASGDLFQLFELKNCFISENNALVGSIATFTKGKNVFIEGTMFSKNTAYAYGGLSLETTSLNLKSSFFNGNYAYGRGAAILVSGVSAQDAVIGVEDIAIMVNNCTFDGNQIVFANRQSFEHFEGAAIAFENCRHLSVVKNSTFIGNSAQFGGAIFSQASIVNISSSKFIRNSADFGGGAIYWEIDSENGRVVDVSSDVENFENWAQFGGFKATDTFRMAVASGPTVVTSGQEVSEPFVITLLDYYDEVVKYEVSNTSNIVYVLTVEDQISAIQGTTLVEAVDGYATFKSLTITYYPETNLDIRFDLSGVPALYYNVEFRSCGYGEIFEQLSTGSVVCTVCAAGFYALELGATVCNSCPENTDCPGGNTLDMDEGFWRVNEFSSEVLKCPVQKSCLGGSNVAEQCRSGHTGMYCDVCEEGYVHGADGSCSGCEAESFVVVAVVIPVIAFFVLVLFVVVTIHSERIKAYLSAQILILADKAEQMNLSSLRTKVKIMITFIQILSQMPNVFGALFPSGFLTFLDIFGVFNLNIINFLSLGCIIESNYHSDLLTATVGPMLLTVIVALSLFFKKIFTRDSFNPYHMAELRKDMLTAVLIISFCIFSPVSITIFQAFSCEPFDDGSNMLVADYSINCNSQTHKNYEIYAGLMILIYPIGIPISYLYLLVKNHQYVNPSAALVVREDEKRLVDRRIIQAEKSKLRETYKEIWHLSFLYENYAPKRWYFEVLDCFRRLFMTAIPVLILRGTTEQLLLVLMASLVWCIIYMQLKPFEMPNDNNIAIMSQWAISFTLIGGVMLKVGEDSRNAQYYVLDVLLVLINATVILSTIYIAAMVDDDDILADLAKDAKRQKVKYGNGNDSDDDSVYKKGAHEIVELPIAHKKTTAEHSVSTENPIHSEQVPNNPNSSDVKPNRRASALGSQLFGTAQLKRASAVNFETESLSHTPVENAETKTATKRGSVLDRLRGKKSKRSSKIDKTGPDSDDDETPPSNSFSAKVGGPNVSDSTVGNHSLFAAHINAAGKRPKNKEDGVDSDDEDY